MSGETNTTSTVALDSKSLPRSARPAKINHSGAERPCLIEYIGNTESPTPNNVTATLSEAYYRSFAISARALRNEART